MLNSERFWEGKLRTQDGHMWLTRRQEALIPGFVIQRIMPAERAV